MKIIVLPKIKHKIFYDWVIGRNSIYTLAISPDEKNGENNDFTLHIEETNQAVDGRDVKDVL